MTAREAVAYGAITGALLAVVLIVWIFAAGGTFGQRCEKAYPGNPREQERCVERLVDGRRVDP